MILSENQIPEIVKLLNQSIHPEAIYLFGSQAAGSANQSDSDVDICVIIKDHEEPYQQSVEAYFALRDLPFPKDVVVRRQSNFEKRSKWSSSLEFAIKNTGRLVYTT